jgi:hypothetical protein
MAVGPVRTTLTFFLPLVAALAAVAPARAGSLEDAFSNGHFFGELRYRYENVEQDGIAKTAQAHTLRADLGFETGLWEDFTARVDFQAVRHLGADDFNDLENGNVAYPIVPDPERSQFREAWLMWTGVPDTVLKGGRQEINLDNMRFIGDGDFRQNDISYDAGTAIWSPISDLSFQYTYLWNINRVAKADFSGNTHLLHGAYEYADWLRLAAYGYFLDINQDATLSTQTYGAQATGAKAFGDGFEFDYLAEYARQSDYADNSDDYRLSYWHITPSLLWRDFIVQGGYESLAGNGTDAVQTPLATLHWFNGWADMFLTTPADGLDDRYGRASYKFPEDGWIGGTQLDAMYHNFRAENTSAHYGNEWDFQAKKVFDTPDAPAKEWTIAVQYAAYDADTLFTNTNKFWLELGTKF